MRPRTRITILIPLAGAGICLAAVARFLLTVRNNGLSWSPDDAAREHYLAVGRSYTQGFVAGFFLCLSLGVAAALLAGWYERRRAARIAASRTAETQRVA